MDLRKVKKYVVFHTLRFEESLCNLLCFVLDRAIMPTEVLQWQHPSHLDKCFHSLD